MRKKLVRFQQQVAGKWIVLMGGIFGEI